MRAEELLKETKKVLVAANERFGHTGDEDDQALELLTYVLGHEPDDDDVIAPNARRRLDRLVQRRCTGEPMAYILRRCSFGDLELEIAEGAFVPRATSEWMATQALRRVRPRKHPVAVELACGIGPIALSVAKGAPHAEVHGCDISETPIRLARRNARKLGLDNARFHVGDLFGGLPKRLRGNVDVVSIHPPYVGRGEIRDLPVEIRRYEPKESLTDRSVDGLGLASRVVAEAPDWLTADGWLLIEIAPFASNQIRALLRERGYSDIRSTHGDLRYTRVITGRRP